MKFFQNKRKIRGYKEFLYIFPLLILITIFAYYPLYGWVYAFFDYKPPVPLSMDLFVGLKWFQSLIANDVKRQQIFMVIRNTFAMSGLTILTSWLPMIFAVFLNEIKCMRYRKVVQTVTTIPNFISWVLVYSIAYNLFNSTGMVNHILTNAGFISNPILFLQGANHIWLKMWLWLTWKNLGWAAIMYIAAISGIDEELYEASKVDGATRMQTIYHITIPSLLPTYFVLLMLSVASFLSNGMEQYYVFQNAFNKDSIQVLDLYVFNLAMGSGSYSVSTALSMLKSLISLVLLCVCNKISKLVRGENFL
ncbi:putative aldouronate transport system permease protein [Lachnotalea glycerini]|uniref:Putative aldouronate transport system permease protein n=1 Tax=Lachnotalea glycerini TaxID=1763509 RepID=A0A255IRB6_9FIRM|nr:ABC transporter permease subunit [Lachnotalea glycerini]PXV93401.1 putative aldouronate transport system permease protein [Lachnotalea glycerini]RDY27778.1 sugar ABC transporter permease [Lachnotalea glycerini]